MLLAETVILNMETDFIYYNGWVSRSIIFRKPIKFNAILEKQNLTEEP